MDHIFEYNEYDQISFLKEIAKKLADSLHCDRFGSCVHFAELFVLELEKHDPELLDVVEVIEGYVIVGDEKLEHTWIEVFGEKIDPTIVQFPSVKKIIEKTRFSGKTYLKDTKMGTWWSERRDRFPEHVFKHH